MFTDDRLPKGGWAEVKPTTPYGQVPVMQSDGRMLAQSNAMMRYVCKLGGLYPEEPFSAALTDEVNDTCSDLFMCAFRYRGGDKAVLKADREKMVNEDIPKFAGGLEKRLQALGSKDFVLESVSMGDVAIFTLINSFKCNILEFVDPNILDEFSTIMGIYRSVCAIPEVVEWHKKHPIPNVEIA